MGGSLVLVQSSIQFINQAHQFYGVHFFARLFSEVVPISFLRGHNRNPLSTCLPRYSGLESVSEQ